MRIQAFLCLFCLSVALPALAAKRKKPIAIYNVIIDEVFDDVVCLDFWEMKDGQSVKIVDFERATALLAALPFSNFQRADESKAKIWANLSKKYLQASGVPSNGGGFFQILVEGSE